MSRKGRQECETPTDGRLRSGAGSSGLVSPKEGGDGQLGGEMAP